MEQQKNIPQLRFPGFEGEWERKKLGEVAEIVTGSTPSTFVKEYYDGNKLFVSPADLQGNRFVYNTKTTLSELGFSKGRKIKKGSVLFVCIGSTIGKVGIAFEDCITNQQINSLFAKKGFENDYIYTLLNLYGNEIKILAGVQAVPQINKSDFSNLCFSFPSLPEQTRIATFFTEIDRKIGQLKQKKTLLEQYKKGVMQQLFSQTLRFKDDNGNEFPKWEKKRLGEISKITTGKLDANAMVENGQYRFYTCAKEFYKIDKYAFDTEALLISGNGANVGYIHYYKGKFNAYQRTYVLDNFNNNIIYIKFYLDNFLSERINTEKKEGNTPYIVLSTLSEMLVSIPSLPEQTKIAQFLSTIDDKIAINGKRLDLIQNFKKGLLQNMFV